VLRCLTLSEANAVGNMHRPHDALDALGPHPGESAVRGVE
jgi:hypothetical protein